MTYVADQVKSSFDSLSTELKDEIMQRDIRINSLGDLIHVLEQITEEA